MREIVSAVLGSLLMDLYCVWKFLRISIAIVIAIYFFKRGCDRVLFFLNAIVIAIMKS
jgi:hypothetical protein